MSVQRAWRNLRTSCVLFGVTRGSWSTGQLLEVLYFWQTFQFHWKSFQTVGELDKVLLTSLLRSVSDWKSTLCDITNDTVGSPRLKTTVPSVLAQPSQTEPKFLKQFHQDLRDKHRAKSSFCWSNESNEATSSKPTKKNIRNKSSQGIFEAKLLKKRGKIWTHSCHSNPECITRSAISDWSSWLRCCTER